MFSNGWDDIFNSSETDSSDDGDSRSQIKQLLEKERKDNLKNSLCDLKNAVSSLGHKIKKISRNEILTTDDIDTEEIEYKIEIIKKELEKGKEFYENMKKSMAEIDTNIAQDDWEKLDEIESSIKSKAFHLDYDNLDVRNREESNVEDPSDGSDSSEHSSSDSESEIDSGEESDWDESDTDSEESDWDKSDWDESDTDSDKESCLDCSGQNHGPSDDLGEHCPSDDSSDDSDDESDWETDSETK